MHEDNDAFILTIIDELIKIKAVKIGEFTLKSGEISPIYIDLREIYSYPQLYMNIVQALVNLGMPIYCKHVLGLLYAGIPLASLYAATTQKPLLLLRKEKKDYGLKKMVEGKYKKGDYVLMIDDLVSDGASKLRDKQLLMDNSLQCNDVHVLIDRCISKNIGEYLYDVHNIHFKAVMTIHDIVRRMAETNQITSEEESRVWSYIYQNG